MSQQELRWDEIMECLRTATPLSPFPWQLSISQEQKRCLVFEISLGMPSGMETPY